MSNESELRDMIDEFNKRRFHIKAAQALVFTARDYVFAFVPSRVYTDKTEYVIMSISTRHRDRYLKNVEIDIKPIIGGHSVPITDEGTVWTTTLLNGIEYSVVLQYKWGTPPAELRVAQYNDALKRIEVNDGRVGDHHLNPSFCLTIGQGAEQSFSIFLRYLELPKKADVYVTLYDAESGRTVRRRRRFFSDYLRFERLYPGVYRLEFLVEFERGLTFPEGTSWQYKS